MKDDFGRLKRFIIFRVLMVAVIAIVIGLCIQYLFIDGILQAPFAEGFVSLCQKFFGVSYYEAANIYQQLFRNQKPFLLAMGLFILLLIIFYFGLSRFTRYFNEIIFGIDKIMDESEETIILSPELDFMEKKLNAVKIALEKRTKVALEAEQRKNDLVVYLAHDIKTPLTSVIGYLSLLDEAPDMPIEQKAKYVSITLVKAYRLEQLINEFFEITRFNLQTIQLDKEKINLSHMLMQMADEFYPMLTPEGKKAVVDAEEDITVFGDADKLARVFNNILKNAISYSYAESTIEVIAKTQDKNIIITFSNQGEIIPSHKLNSIFEKFYRLDTSRSSQTGGAGLGLAIAKEIVNAHGGSILAESSDLGTVFTVILPAEINDKKKGKNSKSTNT